MGAHPDRLNRHADVEQDVVVHAARVHPAALRTDAQAQLAALHRWPHPARCRCGAYICGSTYHQGRRPPAQPAGGEGGEGKLVALPLEVWTAQRPT